MLNKQFKFGRCFYCTNYNLLNAKTLEVLRELNYADLDKIHRIIDQVQESEEDTFIMDNKTLFQAMYVSQKVVHSTLYRIFFYVEEIDKQPSNIRMEEAILQFFYTKEEFAER